MAAKRTKAPTDDGVDDLFDIPKKGAAKAKSAASTKARGGDKPTQDPLADFEKALDNPQSSRPQTPRVKDAAKDSKRTSTDTRPSEDKPTRVPRKSGETTRPPAQASASFAPIPASTESQDAEKKAAAEQPESAAASAAAGAEGGWWGGWFATATATANAAMKQAEHAYHEIQQNEEAKKWAEQVRGNVGALRGLGDDLRQRAIPTFANILHTLAPPISSHERLLIHITHDLVGYPSLDPLVYGVFNRVMSQVEGGDLLVVQRGHENTARRASEIGFMGGSGSSAGWRDGPWWRQTDARRELGAVKGLVEGTKLCRVSAESYAADHFAGTGGVAEAQKRALEPVSEDNPVRTSDIFLAVQAIRDEADPALFAAGGSSSAVAGDKEESSVADVAPKPDEGHVVRFAIYLVDPVHEITFCTLTQELPAKWTKWLDSNSSETPEEEDEDDDEDEDDSDDSDEDEDEEDEKPKKSKPAPTATEDATPAFNEMMSVPEEIREIVEGGGVDPREWVAEWMEEALSLGVGVLAQRYVARRMGVGEGGGRFGKGKQRAETLVQEGGSEAARAGLI